MAGGLEQFAGILDPDDVVDRRVEDEQRFAKRLHFLQQIDAVDLLDEFAGKVEGSPADIDFALPMLADRIEIAVHPFEDVRYIGWRTDRGDGSNVIRPDVVCRRENCRSPKTMPDQQNRLLEPFDQMPGRRD